jgi:hypothetical protein
MGDHLFVSPELINTTEINILPQVETNQTEIKLKEDYIQIKNKTGQVVVLIGTNSLNSGKIEIKKNDGTSLVTIDNCKVIVNGSLETEYLNVSDSLIAKDLSVTDSLTTKDLSVADSLIAKDLSVTNSLTTQDLTVNGTFQTTHFTTSDSLAAQNLNVTNSLTARDLSVTNSLTARDLSVTGTFQTTHFSASDSLATQNLSVTSTLEAKNLIVSDSLETKGTLTTKDLIVTGSITKTTNILETTNKMYVLNDDHKFTTNRLEKYAVPNKNYIDKKYRTDYEDKYWRTVSTKLASFVPGEEYPVKIKEYIIKNKVPMRYSFDILETNEGVHPLTGKEYKYTKFKTYPGSLLKVGTNKNWSFTFTKAKKKTWNKSGKLEYVYDENNKVKYILPLETETVKL